MLTEQRVFIIIQARLTSERLPRKVLLPLCGTTMLGVMLKRLAPLRSAATIAVATTDDGSEDPILVECKAHDVLCFRGSTENVLARYHHAATQLGATAGDLIIRLTADCPLIDPWIVADLIAFFRAGNYDYASNWLQRTYPRGLDAEIFPFEMLERAYERSTTAFEREHVTPYLFMTGTETFRHGAFVDKENNSHYRITVDTDEDFAVIVAIYQHFNGRTDFNYQELLKFLQTHPDITAINAHIQQKTS